MLVAFWEILGNCMTAANFTFGNLICTNILLFVYFQKLLYLETFKKASIYNKLYYSFSEFAMASIHDIAAVGSFRATTIKKFIRVSS